MRACNSSLRSSRSAHPVARTRAVSSPCARLRWRSWRTGPVGAVLVVRWRRRGVSASCGSPAVARNVIPCRPHDLRLRVPIYNVACCLLCVANEQQTAHLHFVVQPVSDAQDLMTKRPQIKLFILPNTQITDAECCQLTWITMHISILLKWAIDRITTPTCMRTSTLCRPESDSRSHTAKMPRCASLFCNLVNECAGKPRI